MVLMFIVFLLFQILTQRNEVGICSGGVREVGFAALQFAAPAITRVPMSPDTTFLSTKLLIIIDNYLSRH